MTHKENAFRQFKNAFIWGGIASLIGCFLGLTTGVVITSNETYNTQSALIACTIYGCMCGALFGAFVPVIRCIWYTFLIMIGQVSGAIKGNS